MGSLTTGHGWGKNQWARDALREIFQIEKQREKRVKKKTTTTEYPRTVGQLQEMRHICSGTITRKTKREKKKCLKK